MKLRHYEEMFQGFLVEKFDEYFEKKTYNFVKSLKEI
jgi:hypothetical protein